MNTSAVRPGKPNIVLVLADGLGWQDVNCYDIDEPSPMETPNLDALARKGVQFWQAYSPAPTCAQSRAAIKWRVKMGLLNKKDTLLSSSWLWGKWI